MEKREGTVRKKGIIYYPTRKAAKRVADKLRTNHPGVRVVEYIVGFAVQYYKSGPYHPEKWVYRWGGSVYEET